MTYEDAMGFITQTENHESLRAVGFWDNGPIENMSGSDRSEQNNKLLKWQMDTSSQVYCFGL